MVAGVGWWICSLKALDITAVIPRLGLPALNKDISGCWIGQ